VSDHNKQIVCISSHYWDDAWFRKQHFMSRFVKKGYEVAYIEPSFSMVRTADSDKKNYQTNKLFEVSVERKNRNLLLIKPPRYLPFCTRPFINTLNIRYISFRIADTLRKHGFKDYTLWVYRPEFADGLNIFHHKKLVADIADDEAAYYAENRLKSLYMKRCSETLVKKSDVVIVTASTLIDKFRRISSNIHLAPNGYDSDLFSIKTVKAPTDISEIKGPIVGFIGTLFNFLDFKLLDYIIRKNTDKSFVFIGGCEASVEKEWKEISGYNNVFWLGKKEKENIPAYIQQFDVCINFFKVDDVSKSVSPLKVFEYLALKKPVVSVEMESLMKEKVSNLIYFAKDYNDFHLKLNHAISHKKDESEYQCVKEYSWDSIFSRVFEIFQKRI